jgi:RNA polymerase sigma-70 factor (ECF subfamily)
MGDEDLVRAAQGGDAAAFGQLYERYFDKVYSYLAFKAGSRTDAEDMAGQVFLRALEAITTYRWKGTPFQAWLFRIAHNLLVDSLRRHARRPSEPLDETFPDGARFADPEGWLVEKVTRESLLLAIEHLTELQRHVIILKFGAGLSNAEVAHVLGRTEGAVKALQHSGLRSLQRRLAKAVAP